MVKGRKKGRRIRERGKKGQDDEENRVKGKGRVHRSN